MLKSQKNILIFFLLICSSILILHSLTQPLTYTEYKNDVFQLLIEKRATKKHEVRQYLQEQQTIAMNLAQQPIIVDTFSQLLTLYQKNALNTPQFYALEHALEEYYVFHLDKFYDVLFLNTAGDIFFSIKKELDLFKNIHDPMFKDLALSQAVKKLKDKMTFVDYEYYDVSSEPASFYVLPIFDHHQKIGSILLQLPINQINSILTNREGLGRTGEVYLINNKHLMLSQSRFFDDDSILTKKIETEAIRNANIQGTGEKVILDYRAKRVLSAYEKTDFIHHTDWIIVAEIDEDEIITNYYLELEDTLFSQLKQYIKQHQTMSSECHVDLTDALKVDVKEYCKSKNGTKLYTNGVATCTALSLYIPNKFGYLLHIPPTDAVYGHSAITKWFLEDDYSNMIDLVMKRIYRFDIYPYEKSLMQFGIVATHEASLKQAIHQILDYGIDLSQIRIAFHPESASVNVVLNYQTGKTDNYWNTPVNFCSTLEDGFNLSDIVKKLVES